jgi:hypothetical protein
VEVPQRRKGEAILLSEFHKNRNIKETLSLSFLDKIILNIFTNNCVKHTVWQWSTVASTALCRVAP